MLLTTLAVATLWTAPPLAGAPAAGAGVAIEPRGGGGDHGKIPWFQGSFEEALAQAKASKKLIFVDFWTSWCGWCKRLDKDTFSDDSVVAEVKDIICLSIDAESKDGRPIAARYKVKGYPALFIIGSDGNVEDSIGGYLPPDKFKKEIQRVRSGQGTVSGLRKKLDAEKSNIESRFELALKLQELGDQAGYETQMIEIKRLDPEGRSLAMHRMAFDEVIARITAGYQQNQGLDIQAMTDFLEKETYAELLFKGNASLAQMHLYLGQKAEEGGDAAGAKNHPSLAREAMKVAWKHVPEAQRAEYGNTVAWNFYEAREILSQVDKAFALEVAEKVVATAKDNVNALDTYACCLFMNGRKDEAQKQIERCIELDAKNSAWRERLAEFQR